MTAYSQFACLSLSMYCSKVHWYSSSEAGGTRLPCQQLAVDSSQWLKNLRHRTRKTLQTGAQDSFNAASVAYSRLTRHCLLNNSHSHDKAHPSADRNRDKLSTEIQDGQNQHIESADSCTITTRSRARPKH
jgi:hypothetical protein